MKYLVQTYKEKQYPFIALETIQDVKAYSELNSLIRSKQSIDFWFGFNSQPDHFKRTPMNYALHEVNENPMAWLLAHKMERRDKTTLVDYCNIADKFIIELHESLFNWVSEGKIARINKNGGCCHITKEDLNEYEIVEDINEQQLSNFLLHREINFEFKINNKTIVIENDNYFPKEVIRDFIELTKINSEDIQVITSFKKRTLLFKKEDYIKFFDEGVMQGVENVVFETTAQDVKQIEKIQKVLEYIMIGKNRDKQLNIFIKTYEHNRHLFKTEKNNIKIIFL